MRKSLNGPPSKHSKQSPAGQPQVPEAKGEGLWQHIKRDLPGLVRKAVREVVGTGHESPKNGERLLTKEEVAERLQVSPRTVDTLAASGDLPRLKIRGCVRFEPGAIDAYLQRRAAESRGKS